MTMILSKEAAIAAGKCGTCWGFGKLSDPGSLVFPIADKRPPWHKGEGRWRDCPDCSGLKEKIKKAKAKAKPEKKSRWAK